MPVIEQRPCSGGEAFSTVRLVSGDYAAPQHDTGLATQSLISQIDAARTPTSFATLKHLSIPSTQCIQEGHTSTC